MTSKRVTTLTLVLAAALAGCGNYSNEDLEYMNAVPCATTWRRTCRRRGSCGERSRAVVASTHDVINASNGLLDCSWASSTLSAPIQPDAAHAQQPHLGTGARRPEQLGWQWQFIVTRDPAAPAMFAYALEFQRIGDAPTCWHRVDDRLVRGGERRPPRHRCLSRTRPPICVSPATRLKTAASCSRSIDVTYSTRDFPISVGVEIIQFADDVHLANTNTFALRARPQEDGRARCGSRSRSRRDSRGRRWRRPGHHALAAHRARGGAKRP